MVDKVLGWLEFNFITQANLFVQLDCWTKEARSKKLRKGFWVIWHAAIWPYERKEMRGFLIIVLRRFMT